ncbi:MAG: acylneuraminate cytidylyltransferase [Syntrophomonadaceae bacterium]|nr:acylneuraminate cytidylyltransferase [Syntrophomonadaceae bacterium]
MKTVIITQARMTSTRLPGKVLKNVFVEPLIGYHVKRLKRVGLADEVIVATTINTTDDLLIKWCEENGIKYYRGSEEDVLSRYYETAKEYNADVIVRVTSDCPLIDPDVVNGVIKVYLDNRDKYDYVSNTLTRTYPRGMDTEVFSFKVLEEINNKAVTKPDREHVTPYIYRNPQIYRLGNLSYKTDESHHRWTVDTPEDFELIKKILEYFYPNTDFTLEECLQLLKQNPEWALINKHIEQKAYAE